MISKKLINNINKHFQIQKILLIELKIINLKFKWNLKNINITAKLNNNQ